MKKIVIVGAGYAGVLAAKKLARKFKKNPDVDITVIDKNPYHTMLTELHEVAAGRVPEESVRVDCRKIFAGRRIRFVQDTVASADFKEKRLQGKGGDYDYDYLVVAAGSQPTYFGVPGAKEHAYTLWSLDDAVRLRHRIEDCFRLAATEPDADKKRRYLSFWVVGAGLTGVEMIGELAEYVPILCDRFNVDRGLVTMGIVDFVPRVVPTMPEKSAGKIARRLEKMGVSIRTKTRVVEIGEDYLEMEGDGQYRQEACTVIWVAGTESADFTARAGEEIPSRGRGRLETDAYLRSVEDDSVYVAGDNIFYIPEGEEAPVPQMVENCEQSADVVAHNIWCAVTGGGQMEAYNPSFHGVMVCVGGRYGTAHVGGAGRKIGLPSFPAIFVKHFINIVYFFQVLGWNKVAGYLKHEFFTIRNRRSFVGGHFSNRSPTFLLVPLRIWLGAVWVFEGIMKLIEGWLKGPKLEGFFGGASAWFDAILGSGGADGASGGTAVADAVSAATGVAGETVGRALVNFNFIGLFRAIFVSGKPLGEAAISDYAFKLDIPALNWFVGLILGSQGLTVAMQTFIVLAEILIGLAMMSGLLTTVAALASLVLLFMFTATTGLYLSSFWMVFAAVAIMFGAGRVFGLDYYASPLLKKSWRRIGWVRRSYLYHD